MATMQQHVTAGGWRTVYHVWGSTATRYGVFRRPSGTKIRVRYGVGWLGKSRQRQTLDGIDAKTLKHSGITNYLRVRFQVKVPFDTDITWELLVEGPHTH